MSAIRYQPHIDGLRAVAVSLVILNHLGDWLGLGGGFVGVDVFFVISGFLITSIVAADIDAGTFTFAAFYKRRVCDFPVAGHAHEVQGVERVFARLAPQFPTVSWIRVDSLMCDARHCVTELDGVPLYFDQSHLNDVASRLLARKWIAAHGNPLADPAPSPSSTR